MPAGSFTADITAIRERAREKMEEGPVTGSYGKDPKEVIAVLNEVLATEIVCWMRYTRHAISATGINRAQVAGEFTEHAESSAGTRCWRPSGSASWAASPTSTRRR
jgi:bacterioferritin